MIQILRRLTIIGLSVGMLVACSATPSNSLRESPTSSGRPKLTAAAIAVATADGGSVQTVLLDNGGNTIHTVADLAAPIWAGPFVVGQSLQDKSALRMYDLTTGISRLVPLAGPPTGYVYSTDGGRVVVGVGTSIVSLDPATGAVTDVVSLAGGIIPKDGTGVIVADESAGAILATVTRLGDRTAPATIYQIRLGDKSVNMIAKETTNEPDLHPIWTAFGVAYEARDVPCGAGRLMLICGFDKERVLWDYPTGHVIQWKREASPSGVALGVGTQCGPPGDEVVVVNSAVSRSLNQYWRSDDGRLVVDASRILSFLGAPKLDHVSSLPALRVDFY